MRDLCVFNFNQNEQALLLFLDSHLNTSIDFNLLPEQSKTPDEITVDAEYKKDFTCAVQLYTCAFICVQLIIFNNANFKPQSCNLGFG